MAALALNLRLNLLERNSFSTGSRGGHRIGRVSKPVCEFTMVVLSAADYCIELASRSLRACGHGEEASARADEHVQNRNRVMPRPLAPFFIEPSMAAESAGG